MSVYMPAGKTTEGEGLYGTESVCFYITDKSYRTQKVLNMHTQHINIMLRTIIKIIKCSKEGTHFL